MSRSNQINHHIPISDRNHVLTFGKYRGYVLGDLIQDDPAYVEWLHSNTDFELDHILLEEVTTSYEEAARNAKLGIDRWDTFLDNHDED